MYISANNPNICEAIDGQEYQGYWDRDGSTETDWAHIEENFDAETSNIDDDIPRFYSDLRGAERTTTECTPDRLGFEIAYATNESLVGKGILTILNEAVNGSNVELWHDAVKYERNVSDEL